MRRKPGARRQQPGVGDNRRVNEDIQVPQVRLIDQNGEQVGIVDTEDAIQRAAEVNLDVVELDPNADPPVCRVMDFGKWKFEQSKKQQAAKKKQKQIEVKEVKFRPGTDEGDYQVKLRNLKRFLDDGDKVKVTLRFRGREMAHQELGLELLERVERDLEELATVDQRPRMEGRLMVMMMSPRKGR
ncbi:translation initiation factor IF-3 [Spiribacter halobius]|uniref:Translation initiation factor IF-3 n=1 Tax=Sediminicurvatus halobius TaxID=2182432 RepID=A0A2U2MW70_9GAMM|nr:translation initiation factor IF-3 [Spiribacter halobius]PWG61100.1 translation initiation factor IF-3 [Spiribacter halobius]UEX79883.1 translation initiation factor IF-3 [Spiribacter halobius]